MSLYSRITANGMTPGTPRLRGHAFVATLGEWADGTIDQTRALADVNLSAGSNLTAAEITELQTIRGVYVAKATAAEKVGYLWKIERVVVRAGEGLIPTEAEFRTALGYS